MKIYIATLVIVLSAGAAKAQDPAEYYNSFNQQSAVNSRLYEQQQQLDNQQRKLEQQQQQMQQQQLDNSFRSNGFGFQP
jgi:cell shape-determining protein MreC